MPELLGQEILFDFKVGAVIDLTLADGLLAQAALPARIPYTGLVFTRGTRMNCCKGCSPW